MSKILVTGATGFTGSHLTKRLIGGGHEVKIIARQRSNTSLFELTGAKVVTGDLIDVEAVHKAVEGSEIVFHIAALFRKAGLPDSAYWDANYHGTHNLLKASLESGVKRFVHCSTIGVHSHVENPPVDETAPYAPGDIYQQTKAEAEKMALKFHNELGLPVSVIRPTGIYGPGDMRWHKLFKTIANGKFMMLGNGETFIHMIYVSDLVDAFLLAAENPKAIGEVYIAGGDRYVTINELAKTIARVVDVPDRWLSIPVKPVRFLSGICEDFCRAIRVEPPIYRRRVDFFVKNRAFDISKAKNQLGFNPKVSLKDGISLTTNWYKEQNFL